jgi:hypothetical protein
MWSSPRRSLNAARPGREEGVGKLDQAVTDGKGCGGDPVLSAGLVKDMGEVRVDRFLAEDQLLGNLGGGQPPGHQAQHFDFACRQSSRIVGWRCRGGGRRWNRQLSLVGEGLLWRLGSSLCPRSAEGLLLQRDARRRD